VLPEFQRSFGESLPSFTKSAVCWQFCWQLQLGSSQLVDAQASKLEARVGIEQGVILFQNSPKPFGSGYFSKCCTGKEIIKPVC
jgi:hypothetical protein